MPSSLTLRRLSHCTTGLLLVGCLALAGGCAQLDRRPPVSDRTAIGPRTALDRYVAKPDSHYHYELIRSVPGKGYTAYVLNMISQAWRTPREVDRTLWQHWLVIIVPDSVKSHTGMLFIDGGSNGHPPPKAPDPRFVEIAKETHSVVADLKMVPNEPLTFADEPVAKSEDAIIAYTWDKYLRTGDSTWPLRLPMTKSAVRGMDTVTSFCARSAVGGLRVDHFVVAGGSKRGWTTWTTAAVDRRVVAIVPIVIDMLNLVPSFAHHYRAYGFYSSAVHDYVAKHIMQWMGTPRFASLMKIVDPYSYRQRMTLPKCLINSTGDQFFLPDSSQFYFKDLPGIKYLRYVPNTNHSLDHSDAIETLIAFDWAILNHAPLPKFSWTVQKDDSIRVVTSTRPSAVKLWQATNPEARDFRLETIGAAWTSSPLADQGGGVYVGRVPVPLSGWTAFMVELTFPNPGGPAPFKFTTQVKVVPDRLPFRYKKPKPPVVGGQHSTSING